MNSDAPNKGKRHVESFRRFAFEHRMASGKARNSAASMGKTVKIFSRQEMILSKLCP